MGSPKPIRDDDALFCSQLAQIVRERGINVSEIARRTGVPRKTLYRLLDGQPPTLGQALALAGAVGLPIEGLAAADLAPAEALLIEAVRLSPPDPGLVAEALRTLGVPMPTIERNPSNELSPHGLRKVGKAASGLAAAIAEVVGDEGP